MIYARARAKRETNDERSHQFRIYQKGLVENVWRVCRWRCVFYSPEIRVLPFLPLWDEPVPRGCPRHCSDEFEKTWQKKMLIVNMKIATGVFTHQVSFFTRTSMPPSLFLSCETCDLLLLIFLLLSLFLSFFLHPLTFARSKELWRVDHSRSHEDFVEKRVLLMAKSWREREREREVLSKTFRPWHSLDLSLILPRRC